MRYLLILLSIIPVFATAAVTITIDVQMGEFSSVSGSQAPLNSYAVVVADTLNNGFVGQYTNASNASFGAFDGTSLTVGSPLGGSGDDEILGVFQMEAISGNTSQSGIFGQIGIDTALRDATTGDNLAVFWFPTVSTASITGTLTEYGYYRSDTVDFASDIAFVVPGDPSNSNLFTFTFNLDGTDPQLVDLTAVPEPKAFALVFGLIGLAFVFYRRRRA